MSKIIQKVMPMWDLCRMVFFKLPYLCEQVLIAKIDLARLLSFIFHLELTCIYQTNSQGLPNSELDCSASTFRWWRQDICIQFHFILWQGHLDTVSSRNCQFLNNCGRKLTFKHRAELRTIHILYFSLQCAIGCIQRENRCFRAHRCSCSTYWQLLKAAASFPETSYLPFAAAQDKGERIVCFKELPTSAMLLL